MTGPTVVRKEDMILPGPFDPEMWDVTVVHKGRVVRARFSERGWRYGPFFLQDEIEQALRKGSA